MDREKLAADLTRDEGRRATLYLDAKGIPTIGIGHNLKAKPISDAAIDQIFRDDVADVERDLDARLPWWRGLSEIRQRVLANMCFNLGIDGLCGFKRTLAAIKAGHYALAADFMAESLWDRQVGARADRLESMMRHDREPA